MSVKVTLVIFNTILFIDRHHHHCNLYIILFFFAIIRYISVLSIYIHVLFPTVHLYILRPQPLCVP